MYNVSGKGENGLYGRNSINLHHRLVHGSSLQNPVHDFTVITDPTQPVQWQFINLINASSIVCNETHWPHIYPDMLQNAPFRSQIFTILFASGGKRALTP